MTTVDRIVGNIFATVRRMLDGASIPGVTVVPRASLEAGPFPVPVRLTAAAQS